ncbi:MAG: GNAT family N-acetyltransferase [Lachnoclostridium sp.]|nr:GNAT family N-acetyltransferase [Lachnoclostridium sp.]
MSKRDEIKKIYREAFNDSEEYIGLVFNSVYNDQEALAISDTDGKIASSLMLRQYQMTFHGTMQQVGYIYAAATRRARRGCGLMTALLVKALEASAARGDMLCSLIPSTEALYYFYEPFGFTTLFYMKEQRFTSLHRFLGQGSYQVNENPDPDQVYEAFNRYQLQRECYITHDRKDFNVIIEDNRLDGGDFVVMIRDDEDLGPVIASMAWAVVKDNVLIVTDLMGEDLDARLAAMRQLRAIHSELPFLLYGRPTDVMGGRLMPRGMARIVNVEKCLQAIAEGNPKFKCKIRVTDPILRQLNSHTYIIHGGKVTIDDSYCSKLDFDVTIEVFGRMVFNSAETGQMIDFPSVRPMISLMLD